VNYEADDFLRLMEEVEFQGGVHRDETCSAKKYAFVGDKAKPVVIAGCGNLSLFEVPYAKEPKAGAAAQGVVTVCAVDDDMGRWPRFQHVIGYDPEVKE
jgi:hypothetical protein